MDNHIRQYGPSRKLVNWGAIGVFEPQMNTDGHGCLSERSGSDSGMHFIGVHRCSSVVGNSSLLLFVWPRDLFEPFRVGARRHVCPWVPFRRRQGFGGRVGHSRLFMFVPFGDVEHWHLEGYIEANHKTLVAGSLCHQKAKPCGPFTVRSVFRVRWRSCRFRRFR